MGIYIFVFSENNTTNFLSVIKNILDGNFLRVAQKFWKYEKFMIISAKAKKIHQEAIIIDCQLAFEVDMPWEFSKKWGLVDHYANAGFTAIMLSLANEETSFEKTLEYLSKIRKYIFSHPKIRRCYWHQWIRASFR